MDLAVFDFDGTITIKGTYPAFVTLATRPTRKLVGGMILSPLLIGYQCGLVSDPIIRKAMSRVAFYGDAPARLRELGAHYAREVLPGLVRPLALGQIAWHKGRGDHVVIVSASLDVYLAPWCETLGVEVICTQLEIADGRVTGRYVNGDCYGEEKARRIRERYRLADYGTVYAYGDSEEDREMLAIADKKYFRWDEVRDVPRGAATRE